MLELPTIEMVDGKPMIDGRSIGELSPADLRRFAELAAEHAIWAERYIAALERTLTNLFHACSPGFARRVAQPAAITPISGEKAVS